MADRRWVYVDTDAAGRRRYACATSLADALGQVREGRRLEEGAIVVRDAVWHVDERRRLESRTNVWGVLEGDVEPAGESDPASILGEVPLPGRFDREAGGMVIEGRLARRHRAILLPDLSRRDVAAVAWAIGSE